MRFESIIQLPSVETGVWKRFGVHVFEGKLTTADMLLLEVSGDSWHKRNPGALVELVIIYPSDAVMTTEERQRMSKLIKRWEKERAASATVVLASGLLGSLHRSVLTGLTMLSPPPHPWKVFGETRAATMWLAPYAERLCGAEAKGEELLRGIEALCESFLERRRRSSGKVPIATPS
jgi:hypothetical protein